MAKLVSKTSENKPRIDGSKSPTSSVTRTPNRYHSHAVMKRPPNYGDYFSNDLRGLGQEDDNTERFVQVEDFGLPRSNERANMLDSL